MMAGSHLVVGAAAWAITARLGGAGIVEPLALGAAALGALLPDVDHPHSRVGRLVKPVSVPLSLLLGHRGVTHSLLAVLAALYAAGRLGMAWMAAPVAVGYLSHLAADALTPAGVPLLWPLRARFALPLARTGGMIEIILVVLVAAAGALAAGLF